MPPSTRMLKFDLTLLTGNLERNFKRCTVGLMKGWRDFGNQIKKSNSFLEAGDAIYAFGKKGVESIMSLFHPYEALVGKVVAVGYAVKKACAQFEEFEKAGLKASNAFKTGGIVKDFDKFKGMIQNQTAGGMGNITDAMGALGSVRKANPALNSGELSAIAELSTGAAAFNGEEYADAFERLGEILGEDSVSLEKLTSAGINFTFNEWQQVKAMNNRMMMHERNRIIIEKMKETYKDAEKAEATTLSGMYRRIGNMLENLKVRLGEAIAPLAKPFFQLAVLVMNMAEGFIKPFVGIAKVIGAVFKPLTTLLTKCAGLCKLIGTLLGIIVTVWIAKWIKGQLTILVLNTNFKKIFITVIKGWRDATRYLNTYIVMMKAAHREQAAWMAGKALTGGTTYWRGQLRQIGHTKGGKVGKSIAGFGGSFLSYFAGARTAAYASGTAGGTTAAASGGWLAATKVFMANLWKMIVTITRGAMTIAKFAGEITAWLLVIIAAIKLLKKFFEGIKEGFSWISKDAKGFGDMMSSVGSALAKIGEIFDKIAFDMNANFQIIVWLVKKLGQAIGYLLGRQMKALDAVLTATDNAVNSLSDKVKLAQIKMWEGLGYDMSKEREDLKREREARNKKDDKGFMPADLDFSSSFEGAASMTQRIQTALVSKNSPQAKMVDYLHDIREYMKGMNDAQNKQVEAQKEDNALMKEQNKKLGNLEPGLA